MSRLSIAATLGALALTFVLVGWLTSNAVAASADVSGIVKLYSAGAVVGEWKSAGPGRSEGETFVFLARDGVRDLEVRIRGTFSYEENR